MTWVDLEKRLTTQFGVGQIPVASRRLYARLQREVNVHGEPVMRIISDCAEASICAKIDRGAWFRRAVVARLREHGYLLTQQQEARRSALTEMRDRVIAAVSGAASSDERGY